MVCASSALKLSLQRAITLAYAVALPMPAPTARDWSDAERLARKSLMVLVVGPSMVHSDGDENVRDERGSRCCDRYWSAVTGNNRILVWSATD